MIRGQIRGFDGWLLRLFAYQIGMFISQMLPVVKSFFRSTLKAAKRPRPGCPERGLVDKSYLFMFICAATSAAKSSTFFSMPSPFSKRTALTKRTVPPRALAAEAI